MLFVIPIMTTGLAFTNSMHGMVWSVIETDAGWHFSEMTDHYWYNRVYAPFTYGLFGYTAIALVGRLPSIAPAHRKTVGILLTCALLPFAVSVANTGDRPIQIGSHYHFYETNKGLVFEREASRGFRLDIPAGTAVRFEPGQTREVTLVSYAGTGTIYGFNAQVMGKLEEQA